MGDIFADTQVPAWLTHATAQKPGQLGHIIGTLVGGAANALERDPQADPKDSWLDSRKGLREGLFEARMNEADPLWQLKVAQTQAATLGRAAQAQNAFASAQQKIAETAAWMKDSETLSPWLSARPEDRSSLPVPTATSKIGATLIQRTQSNDDRYFVGQEANKVRQQTADNQTAAAKSAVKDAELFNKTLDTVTDPVARAKIRTMRDKNGMPTPDAWIELDGADKVRPAEALEGKRQAGRESLMDKRQEGQQTLEAQRQEGRETLQDSRATAAQDLESQKAKEKLTFETERQKDRLELQREAGKNKIDLAKLQASLKVTGKDGKVIGKDEFVNRHFNQVFAAISKQAEAPDALKDSRKAMAILERTYDSFKPEPKPAAAAAPASAGTNAPAVNDDPLGLRK